MHADKHRVAGPIVFGHVIHRSGMCVCLVFAMVFNSVEFAIFFACLYAAYLITMRRLRLQNLLLLAGSYFFYGCWDWRFLGLIVLSTIVDYVCGLVLDRRREEGTDSAGDVSYMLSRRARQGVLAISVAANLGILGVFKYFDFFATSCAGLLNSIGLGLEPWLLDVILPVGISFYTFQTLSYTIDVYRGELRAHHNLLDFAVFVAFFPQLVAGPILRAKDFLPQVCRERRLIPKRVYEGGYLFLWGLFKKVVIADNLAVLVDKAFDQGISWHHGGVVVVAVYAFAIQIYCDFSGYSNMARGCGKMMGFDIALNFNLPYFAKNPSEFWRRWHISLSDWFRDYVYIPLGGNRKGRRRTVINLAMTMVPCGLWHGAAWTFIIWGVYHGLLLAFYREFDPLLDRVGKWFPRRFASMGRFVRIAVFFQFTCLGWLIFRAESVSQLGSMLKSVFTPWLWWLACGADSLSSIGLPVLAICALPLLIVQIAQERKGDLNCLLRLPSWGRGMAYSAMFFGLVVFGGGFGEPFIYFQF